MLMNIWAVSFLATECIQTHLESSVPQLTLTDIGHGCKGYRNNIFISSKSDLISKMDIILYEFFIGFNNIYQNMATYGIW